MVLHTRGPWSYKRCDIGHQDNAKNPMVTSAEGSYVCRVGWHGSTIPGMTSNTCGTFEEAEANAYLIAAAPLLLATLIESVGPLELYHAYGWPDRDRLLNKIAAAIAAARPA